MGMGVGRRGSRAADAAVAAARSGLMSEINVTPLVDVMLVLLIVFMVAAPMMTVGVPIDLPQTAGEQLETPAQADHGFGHPGGRDLCRRRAGDARTRLVGIGGRAGRKHRGPHLCARRCHGQLRCSDAGHGRAVGRRLSRIGLDHRAGRPGRRASKIMKVGCLGLHSRACLAPCPWTCSLSGGERLNPSMSESAGSWQFPLGINCFASQLQLGRDGNRAYLPRERNYASVTGGPDAPSRR